MSELRGTIMALAAAFVAVGGYAAIAQGTSDAGPDRSQDIAWMNGQQAYLAGLDHADGWRFLDGGLRWRRTEGDGSGAHPSVADTVTVHYEGTFTDGEVFDSSFARGAPAIFTPETVVPGWTEALQKMRVGDEWILYVPPELGYGERGGPPAIPPNAVLIFRLKLLDIAKAPGGGPIGGGATAMG